MSAAPPPRLRVDVSTGEVVLEAVDAVVPGPVPLALRRAYRSQHEGAGALGPGWRWGLDAALAVEGETVRCEGGPFDGATFAAVAEGRAARLDASGLVLDHLAEAYVVWATPRRRYVYAKAGGRGGRLPLSRIQGTGGAALTLAWRRGQLAEVRGAPGGRLRFEYAGGRLTAVVREGVADPVVHFGYERGHLASATVGRGRTDRYAYDGGRLVEHAGAGGTTLAQYDAEGRGLAVWGSWGPGIRLGYDTLRHTTRVVGADGGQTLYRHAAGAQVLERVPPEGAEQVYYYGADGRLVGFGDGDGPRVFQALDPDTGRLTLLAGRARGAAVDYDADGRAVAAGPLGDDAPAVSYVWDDAHALAGLTDARGGAWRFDRDRAGRVAAVTSPAGRRVTLAWLSDGLAVDDAQGRRWRETWDAAGRVVGRVDRAGRQEHRRYDAGGHLDAAVVEGGYWLQAVHDGAGRLASIADADGARLRLDRDAAGRVARVTGALDAPVAVGYDVHGRVAGVRPESGHGITVEYDVDGRLARIDGPRETTTYGTDDGEIVVGDRAGTRRYTRDGALVAVDAAEGGERFSYGLRGELRAWETRRGEVPAGFVSFDYGPDGVLARIAGRSADGDAIDLGLVTDADGWLTAVEAGGEPLATLTLDPIGRPVAVAGAVAATLAFDAADRLVRAEGAGATVEVAYDEIDRPTRARSGPDTVEIERAPGGVWEQTLAIGAEASAVRLGVRVDRRGVVLTLHVGAVPVVLWARAEARCPAASPTARRVAAVVRGAGAALPARPLTLGARLAPWAPAPGVRSDHTAVPRAADLGLPWPVLDAFYLDPGLLDARPDGTAVTAGRGRDPFPNVTGTHVAGPLRAAPWRAHGLAAVLPPPDPLDLGGGPDLGALLARLRP
ncbi:DUF6531 domain-containing protein [Rubrivirga sp. IMCC45206]|uniref:DUF6531 domain-containing protein n=1 Tax=Rubrivirga sp. IMCC45206 TaxID=3391614 RepID=UPI00398FA7F6